MREAIGPTRTLMVDANQRWNVGEAIARMQDLAQFKPLWIEEPIAADHAHAAWRALASASAIPLAAGENLRGQQAFGQWVVLTPASSVAASAGFRLTVF